MKRRFFPFLLVLILIASLTPIVASGQTVDYSEKVYLPVVMRAPDWKITLKWQYGGCYASWCETGWYSSPAVDDVDADGKNEVIAGAYTLVELEGDTGTLIRRFGGSSYRVWPGIVVADLTGDGKQEIVTAQGGGYVTAYNLQGGQLWRKQPAGNSSELRGLLVADMNGDGRLEVVVTRAGSGSLNTWVLDGSNGSTLAGWPQIASNGNGYAAGVYNNNAAAGDIDGDGRLELVVPSDVHYINAYEANGASIRANSTDYPNKYWGQVGVWENLDIEKRGWGDCNGDRAQSYRANFDDGPAVISDLNGDGKKEVVATGSMYDCSRTGYPNQYIAPFIFNGDRSRFNTGGYDWRKNPVDTGRPLEEDYNRLETAQTNPVVADIDGDGKKEILFASFDGRLHAFWLDKTEHEAWPYSVNQPDEGVLRLASEPVVADLNNDGKAEILFTSWTSKGSKRTGKVHLLDWTGRPLRVIDLPQPLESSETWNGGLAAPTLANIDSDPGLELIVNTAQSGVVAYDLSDSANARVLWGTGRGNFRRDGTDQ